MSNKPLFEIQSDVQNKSTLFDLINPTDLDESKETMLVITFNTFKEKYNHVYGFFHEIINSLEKDYNIVYAGKEIKKNIVHLNNFYNVSIRGYSEISKNYLKRKKQSKNSVEHNERILFNEFNNAFGDIKIDKILFATSDYFVLPLTQYFSDQPYKSLKNEFHDYIGNDEDYISETLKRCDETSEKFNDRVSLLAFTMFYKNIFLNLPVWINKNNDLKMIYCFSIDPVSYMHYFTYHKLPHKRYYFVDDKRGTRNYEKFPIAEIQHLIHENRFNYIPEENLKTKTKDFFFMGTIFQDKGDRRDMWYKFLENLDLSVEKSSIWVPIKLNGIIKNKKDLSSRYTKESIVKLEEKYGSLLDSIKSHKLYKNHLLPNQVKSEICQYKYGLVLRCVSQNDSLNFRPLYYTYLNIIPLLDPQYDPDFLQIPEDIQKDLIVHNEKDIQEKIQFYNDNENLRLEMLEKLYRHFDIETFLKSKDIIINNIFNEN